MSTDIPILLSFSGRSLSMSNRSERSNRQIAGHIYADYLNHARSLANVAGNAEEVAQEPNTVTSE